MPYPERSFGTRAGAAGAAGVRAFRQVLGLGPGRAAARGLARAAGAVPGAALLAATTVAALPDSTLAVWNGGRWVAWWRSDAAPERWASSTAPLARGVRWRPGARGVEWGELRLSGAGEAWRVRLIVVRLDPAHTRLALAAAVAPGARRGAWTVDSAGAGALLALNAGQFRGGTPWGWVVHRGREYRAPGTGPLAPAVVVDTAGRVRVVRADSIAALRTGARAGAVREAFQSYPALLADGDVPPALRAGGRGVDLAHRDARLALGTLPDGRVLVALTRFDALGGALGVVPAGPTVPEMAAIMGALGARDAVLLDGGISAQLRVRDASGAARRWPGLRRVPLGLVAAER